MADWKEKTLISGMVVAAFAWGYFKNTPSQTAEIPKENKTKVADVKAAAPAKSIQKTAAPVTIPKTKKNTPTTAKKTNSTQSNPLLNRKDIPEIPLSEFANPYKRLSEQLRKAKEKQSLGSALDSVRMREIKESQRNKRNLYFEKLSNQLKELRGGPAPALNPFQRSPEPLKPGAPADTPGEINAKNAGSGKTAAKRTEDIASPKKQAAEEALPANAPPVDETEPTTIDDLVLDDPLAEDLLDDILDEEGLL